MTSDDLVPGAEGEWVCIDSSPDRSAAARMQALLHSRGVAVRLDAGDGHEIEVQVPVSELERAIAELAELDAIDEDERRD